MMSDEQRVRAYVEAAIRMFQVHAEASRVTVERWRACHGIAPGVYSFPDLGVAVQVKAERTPDGSLEAAMPDLLPLAEPARSS